MTRENSDCAIVEQLKLAFTEPSIPLSELAHAHERTFDIICRDFHKLTPEIIENWEYLIRRINSLLSKQITEAIVLADHRKNRNLGEH